MVKGVFLVSRLGTVMVAHYRGERFFGTSLRGCAFFTALLFIFNMLKYPCHTNSIFLHIGNNTLAKGVFPQSLYGVVCVTTTGGERFFGTSLRGCAFFVCRRLQTKIIYGKILLPHHNLIPTHIKAYTRAYYLW